MGSAGILEFQRLMVCKGGTQGKQVTCTGLKCFTSQHLIFLILEGFNGGLGVVDQGSGSPPPHLHLRFWHCKPTTRIQPISRYISANGCLHACNLVERQAQLMCMQPHPLHTSSMA